MQELDGRVCVITGGAGGIGSAMARRFSREGMHVVLGDVERGALDAAASALGGDTLAVECDVTSPASMDALRDAALERFGGVHLVCLNAGVAPLGLLLETSLDTWRWILDVNVMGVVHGIRTFGPLLVAQGEGHVVITASAAGLSSNVALGAYNATKHAVVGIGDTLRKELARSGVGVSVVCPGVIKTGIFDSERNHPDGARDDADAAPDRIRDSYRQVLSGAPGPDLVADAVYEAVVADELFVLPSPEVNDQINERLDAVRAAMR